MSTVLIDKNYKIKIPSEIRKKVGVSKGDKINIIAEKNKQLKINIRPLEISFGCWNYKKSGVEYLKKIRKSWER